MSALCLYVCGLIVDTPAGGCHNFFGSLPSPSGTPWPKLWNRPCTQQEFLTSNNQYSFIAFAEPNRSQKYICVVKKLVRNVCIIFENTLPLAFNTIVDYKITFVNSHQTTTIHKVIVVFPGHIDKDLGYYSLPHPGPPWICPFFRLFFIALFKFIFLIFFANSRS